MVKFKCIVLIIQYLKIVRGGVRMKKAIVSLVLVSLLVFACSFSALGAGQVYLDYAADGDFGEGELSGPIIGGEFQTGSFKFGLDYLDGEVEFSDEYETLTRDFTQMLFKVGYGFTDNVFLTLSMYNGEIEGKDTYDSGYDSYSTTLNGILLGGEFGYDITDKLRFDGSLGISVSGEEEYKSEDYDEYYDEYTKEREKTDIDLITFKLKLTYNFTENLGVALSHNNISYEFEDDSDVDLEYTTLGVVYKF